MYAQQQPQQPKRRSSAGGVIFAVVVILLVIGWIAHHATQQATITTCTNPGTAFASCSQQTVPVTTQGP